MWLVNAKHWTGTVTVGQDGTLRQNGRSRTRLTEQAAAAAAKVRDVLDAAGLDVPVRTVFAFTDAAPDSSADAGAVRCLPAGKLTEHLASAEARLGARTVERAVAVLADAFPPAGDPDGPWVDERDLPDDLRDPERYDTLLVWAKSGKRHLYASRGGRQLGYIDLLDRTIHVESDHPRTHANLEFVREEFAGDRAGEYRRGRTERVALRLAGGCPRTVVGVRERDRTSDRLQVFLHELDGTRSIGSADLLAGSVEADDPALAPLVAMAARTARS